MKRFINNTDLLAAGLAELKLSMASTQQTQLINYLELLRKWNKTYNLTAITDFTKMISHHLLDSLAIAPYITGNNIVDVGSGAGLPGIPLSIYFPDRQFTLIDSVGKKTRFLSQVVRELSLRNVTVVHGSAEEYPSPKSFDTMTARAVASADALIQISTHLLRNQGQLLMMESDLEKENLPASARIITLDVPYLEAKRSLVIV